MGAQKNLKPRSQVIDLVDSPQSELPTPTIHHVYPSAKISSEAPHATVVTSAIAAPPNQPSIPVSSQMYVPEPPVLQSDDVAASAKQTRISGINLLLMLDKLDGVCSRL